MMQHDDHRARDDLENHLDGPLPEDARLAARLGGADRLNAAVRAGRSRGLDRLARDAVAAVAAAHAALLARPADTAAATVLLKARRRLLDLRQRALAHPRTPSSTPR